MPIIRCTAKLFKAMGVTKPEVIEGASDDSLLGDWHANFVIIERKKCMVVINDKTLINFIIPGVTKKLFNDLRDPFCFHLKNILLDCEVTEEVTNRMINEISSMTFAKSNSARHLGFLTELCLSYQFSILQNGGLHFAPIAQIVLAHNTSPWGNKEMTFPNKEINKLVKAMKRI